MHTEFLKDKASYGLVYLQYTYILLGVYQIWWNQIVAVQVY